MKHSLKIFFTIITSTLILFSCSKNADNTSAGGNLNGPQSLRLFLTDHPTPVFDSVFIDISVLELKVSDSSGEHWMNVNIHPGIYNILRLRNGADTLLATGNLPSGNIRGVRLTLGNRNTAVKNNVIYPLRLKDEDRITTMTIDNSQIEFPTPGIIQFWLDFDAGSSIVPDNSGSGNNNGYRLKPKLNGFSKHQSGSIEGRVLPGAAEAVVIAVSGNDSVIAIPRHDNGEFKIMGLRQGTYRVVYDGLSNYRDTTLLNIMVTNHEEIHLPVVTLSHL